MQSISARLSGKIMTAVLLAQHDLKYLITCLCCQPRHYKVAQAAHKCKSTEELIALRDYLDKHKAQGLPANLKSFFEELITRRKQNETHDCIDEQD